MIEDSAFAFCKGLTEVVLPDSLASIGNYVFEHCEGLTRIYIPASVTSIGAEAFGGCVNLSTIYVDETSENFCNDASYAVFLSDMTALIAVPGTLSGSYIIPETVKDIRDGAFSKCVGLTQVTIPTGVTNIGERAFYNCAGLTKISIPDSVTEIGKSAFYNCSSLTELTISKNVTAIGAAAFSECPKLTEVNIPNGVVSISDYLFRGNIKLTEVNIPESVTSIGSGAFSDCSALISITLPVGVRSIGNSAFNNCTALKEITIPASVTSIENYAFSECSSLDVLYFKGDAPEIGNHAFRYVTATVYYPGNNETWTFGVMRDYSGTITWVPYGDVELEITAQPESVYAKTGTNAVFTVEAEGEDLTYQWEYRTSATGSWKITTQTGNKTASLTIPATVARNGYQYRCVITDGAGNKIESDAATLSVFGIKTQPKSVAANVGNTVKFTVSAIGDGLSYQWQWRKNDASSWASTTVTGNKTDTISVAATAARNGYQYRCKVTDAAGNVVYSNGATLTVNATALAITAQPESVSAKLNDTAKFTVAASGDGLTYQWQWRKNASSSWASTTVTGNKTAAISVTVTNARNGYQYRCKITDAAGKILYSDAATLTVATSGLTITSQPKSVSAKLNDAVSFTVAASGEGLTYQWQYRSSATGSWKVTTLTGAKTATLKATATTARNGYQYRCIITDANGNTVTSNTVTLTVQAGLAITSQPENVTAKLNDAVTFTVKASGDGLTYQWQYRSSATGTWKNTTLSGCKTATLTVTATTARNGFQYRCIITDANGNTVNSNGATLTVN